MNNVMAEKTNQTDGHVSQKAIGPTAPWLLIALVALMCLTRVGFAQLDRVIKWDESDYAMLGRNLFAGQGFTTAGYPEVHYPPLLPIVLGAAQQITASPEIASNLVYMLCSTLLVLPFYGLIRRFYGQRVGAMACVLLAIFPALGVNLLYWGTMSEPLYLLLLYSGLSALWQSLEGDRWMPALLAGLCMALAYLTRPDAILYMALAVVLLLLWPLWRKGHHEQRDWVKLAAFLGAFVLLSLPYVVYLHRHTGQWTFSGKVGVTFDLGKAVIESDPADYDRATARLDDSGNHIIWFSPQRFESQSSMMSQVLANPLGLARRILANLSLWQSGFFALRALPFFTLVFMALGLFRRPWGKERVRQELFLLLALLPPFGFLALHIELRFFAPLFPILLAWIALGLDHLGQWLHETWLNWRGGRPFQRPLWPTLLKWLPYVLMVAYFLVMLPGNARNAQAATDFSHKETGLWLQANTPVQARIMCRDVAIAVYANRDWVPSPHAPYDDWLAYARYHGVDYIVAYEHELTVLRPMLSFLLDTDNPPPELELVQIGGNDSRRTVVYRIR